MNPRDPARPAVAGDLSYPAPGEDGDPEILDPATAPVPRYGHGSLADLLPAIVTGQGVPEVSSGLELEPADRACVFLVDGMGWEALAAHPDEAPFLHSLLGSSGNGTGRPLTSGFPSTTAASLASVGTGLAPGEHGLPGYTVLDPATGELMNQLRWRPWTDPHLWQPHPTVFQRADAAGIATCQVTAPHFEHTPLTRIALSGGTFHGRLSGEERMDLAAERLSAGDRALVYTYYAELDGNGHRYGMDSDAWRGQLQYVDRLAERLAGRLPPRSALYITADHGMVDVPGTPQARFDFDEDWELKAGVAKLGGEGRMRHLYAVPGAAADVAAVWREVLAGEAWVATREQAVALGWFGPRVEDRVMARLGDVIVAMSGTGAVVATRSEPNESALIGMHGSATPAEQLVPLLEVRT